MLALGYGLKWGRDREAPVPSDLARAARQLRARDSWYARSVGGAASRWVPQLASRFPRLLGTSGSASRRRLEACHALAARGTAALPALPLVVEAFCDREHEVRAYAFMALVNVQAPADRLVALLRGRGSVETQLSHCARLLADEDEMVRDYAWAVLDGAVGSGLASAGPTQGLLAILERASHQTSDREMERRVGSLLGRLQADSQGTDR